MCCGIVGGFERAILKRYAILSTACSSITMRLPQDTHRQLIIVIIALITAFVNKVADEADSAPPIAASSRLRAFGYTVCQRIEWLALVDNGGF